MAKEPKEAAPASNVVARVLRRIEQGEEVYDVNDVVEFDAQTAAHLLSEGAIDTDPAAVAYAESLAS